MILSIQISADEKYKLHLPEPVTMTFNIGSVCKHCRYMSKIMLGCMQACVLYKCMHFNCDQI